MPAKTGRRIAVLASAGVDSTVLICDLLRSGAEVHPVYARSGLRWEKAELAALRRILRKLRSPRLMPLAVLDAPLGDLPSHHWSVSGEGVPGLRSRDESVYLPGRNLALLAQAGIYCALKEVGTIALGLLKSNPFPDASPRFFRNMARTIHAALGRRVRIIAPYRLLSKKAILRRAPEAPLEMTFSCLNPRKLRPCGRCNKCAERASVLEKLTRAGGRRCRRS